LKTEILIMRPEEPHETRTVELTKDQKDGTYYRSLVEIVEAIVGEPMEHVTVFSDFSGGTNYKYLDMFVNEMGSIMEPAWPVNGAATDIYRRNTLVHEPGTKPDDLPEIFGPAVLFKEKVWS
jgi:hypothetical protein